MIFCLKMAAGWNFKFKKTNFMWRCTHNVTINKIPELSQNFSTNKMRCFVLSESPPFYIFPTAVKELRAICFSNTFTRCYWKVPGLFFL
jgi:hypothetical protein